MPLLLSLLRVVRIHQVGISRNQQNGAVGKKIIHLSYAYFLIRAV